MAHNTGAFHVPQQNIRNKLRVTSQPNQEQAKPNFMNPSPSSSSSYQSVGTQVPFSAHGNLSLSLAVHEHAHQNAFSLGSNDCLRQSGGIRGLVPLGPLTGYASILNRSRFLKPARQVLDDLCGLGSDGISSLAFEGLGNGGAFGDSAALGEGFQHRWTNSPLVIMLDEVCKQYRLYCQQMQSVVESFETVSGLGNTAPYLCVAFKAVMKHFAGLTDTISGQIQLAGTTHSDECSGKDGNLRDKSLKQDHNKKCLQNPVWRSQRGLPDKAVAVLRAWLFENFLHPYPTDAEKQMLALQTGLSRIQVSNWFINARVRVWKPMVEEIHMLEKRRAKRHRSEVTPIDDERSGAAATLDVNLTSEQYSRPGESNGSSFTALALALQRNNKTTREASQASLQ